MASNLLAEPDDLLAALLDRLVDPLLQLILGHSSSPSAPVSKPSDILLPRAAPRLHTGGRPSHSSREGRMDVFHAIVARLSGHLLPVVQGVGIVVQGLALSSYTR